jgi:hypothetical protein
MLLDRQLDLFAAGGVPASADPAAVLSPSGAAASGLDDAAPIAAIPEATVTTYQDRTDEAAKRRLASAIPALEGLCRHFKGFGRDHLVSEQTVAVRANCRHR